MADLNPLPSWPPSSPPPPPTPLLVTPTPGIIASVALLLVFVIGQPLLVTLFLHLQRALPFSHWDAAWPLWLSLVLTYALVWGMLARLLSGGHWSAFWGGPVGRARLLGAWALGLGLQLVVVGLVVGITQDLESLEKDSEFIHLMNASLWDRLFLALMAGLLAPFTEEALFRGALYPALRHRLGVWGGGVLVTLPFTLLHGAQAGWHWEYLLGVALAGGVLVAVRESTGGLRIPIALHMGFNALGLMAMWPQS